MSDFDLNTNIRSKSFIRYKDKEIVRLSTLLLYDLTTYDITTYDLTTYDFTTYDVTTYDITTYDVTTYDNLIMFLSHRLIDEHQSVFACGDV